MKGVILGINPQATIVDITHDVPPQNLREAAFAAYTSYKYFPKGTVHLVVVDPGVGSDRRAIVLITGRGVFVGPDNGVMTLVIAEESRAAGAHLTEEGGLVKLPPSVTGISLTNSQFWLPSISATFHGRDIFAPVAAHLSRGIDPHALGESIDSINTFRARRPSVDKRGNLVGAIVHTDRFGNMVTNITTEDIKKFSTGNVSVAVGERQIGPISNAYVNVQPGQLLSLIGGSGHLEIAARNGNAARLLGVSAGDKVQVRRAE